MLAIVGSLTACAEGNTTSGSGQGGDTNTGTVTGSETTGGSTSTSSGGSAGSSGGTTGGGGASGGTGGSVGGTTSSGGSGGSVGGGGAGGGCSVDEKLCFNICVPVDDPMFGCDDPSCSPCSDAHALPGCVAGACAVLKCDAEWADCNGDASDGCEVHLPADPNNCGACGTVCAVPHGTPGCEAGFCTVAACDPPWSDCDGTVADGCEANVQVDPANCAMCGVTCAPGEQCQDAACGVFCPPGKANCDGDAVNGCEVDLGTVSNCGFCGDACDLAHASSSCESGACAIVACDAGYSDCDGIAANGCEANLQGSAGTCGDCNTVCPSGPNSTPVCQSGACELVCAGGYADCDADPNDGCEQPILTDPSHCGACDTVCVTPNGTPGCANGSCKVSACNPGFADCDQVVGDGCEVNLNNDVSHCGACATVCVTPPNATPTCGGGTCGYACNAGFADCDGQAANGCEVNLNNDPMHCGSCAGVCNLANASAGCAAGVCNIASCHNGFADCDGQAPNGCEINTQTDAGHCGACATACALPNANNACQGGACVIASCQAPFANCDMQTANGCETNTSTSVDSCGSCGAACNLPNASQSCVNGACAVGACTAPFADCDNLPANGCETNTNTSVGNCGSCGSACSLSNAAAACSAGSCAIASCNSGFADCDNQAANGCEINTQTSLANCGGCGSACAPANAAGACASGTCAIASCNAGFANCDNQAANGCEINTQTSLANCGGCGAACSLANAAESCVSGACTLTSCDAGFANCDNQTANGCEINTNTSTANCGGCGNACSLANASQSCVGGACAIGACNAGFGNCDNNVANGCETNLNASLANCGTCGNACSYANAGAACNNGSCAMGSCSSGFANCDNNAANGCEVNTNTSAANCGACGNACSLANASSTCSSGSCAIVSCSGTFANCDGQAANGCEINTATNPNSCGSCGNVCSLPNAVAGCSAGACTVASCAPGWADCDGVAANGCEVNTKTSVGNCGACGNACSAANGTATCSSGTCQVASCNAGYQNCNGLYVDGCEINTQTSVGNCGGCGQICAPANATGLCSSGTCTIGSCNSGYQNCNGTQGDGCEINLQADVQNCGTCGNNCAVSCAGNTSLTACSAGACQIQGCAAGYYNVDGLCSGGCECLASNVSQACNTPQSLGALAVGAAPVTVTANLVPNGVEAWYTITFTGNTNASYHPHVKFTNNPNSAFKFDIRSNCAGGTISCGSEGTVSNGVTDWETFNGAGSPGYYDAIPPVGNNGTILIHVFRASGALSCAGFTLQVSN
ncbi:MAG: hypothetical protein U0441_05605 [Polyangiaceae bacterium]